MKTLVIDIETTGLPPKDADYKIDFMKFPFIVTIAWKINDEDTKYFILNQEGVDIPEEAIKIHGITNEMARASHYTLMMVLIDLLSQAEGTNEIIGHNIFFDTSIIKANILRLIKSGITDQDFYDKFEELLHKDRRIDTMRKSIKFCNIPGPRGPKWPKLTELHQILFKQGFEAHNSKDDVEATHRCYVELKNRKII